MCQCCGLEYYKNGSYVPGTYFWAQGQLPPTVDGEESPDGTLSVFSPALPGREAVRMSTTGSGGQLTKPIGAI